jgi:transmembrane sensor
MDTLRERRRQEELLKVAEQAAEWLIALDEGGVQERAACAAWLEESPLHVEMFLRASAVNQMGDLLDPADRKKMVESAAVNGESHSNVIVLDAPKPDIRKISQVRHETRGRLRRIASVAAAAAAVSIGIWSFVAGPYSWERYATTVGEQRTVELADGSVVYVNTDTRMNVRYTDRAREIRLRSGEALFKVERDSQRPFRVHVGDTVVQAVGTQFNVYRRSGEIKVAVIEGVVQVSKEGNSLLPAVTPHGDMESIGTPKRLSAGQALKVAANGKLARAVRVNVGQVTAWRQGRLVFEWETLGTIADEFNRYNRSPQLRVEGEGVRGRRYTAVFDADNPQTLLRFLAQDSELKFAAEGDDFVIRGR